MERRSVALLIFAAVAAAMLLGLSGCSGGTSQADIDVLKQQVADLQQKVTANDAAIAAQSDTNATLGNLSPGLGEFMMGFQTHMAKIWYAGENGNWDLAKFETGEIVEGIDGAKASRPNTILLLDTFTNNELAQLSQTIAAKNKTQFEAAYAETVQGCNLCHKTDQADAKWPQGRPFIKITVPTAPPVANQQWTP